MPPLLPAPQDPFDDSHITKPSLFINIYGRGIQEDISRISSGPPSLNDIEKLQRRSQAAADFLESKRMIDRLSNTYSGSMAATIVPEMINLGAAIGALVSPAAAVLAGGAVVGVAADSALRAYNLNHYQKEMARHHQDNLKRYARSYCSLTSNADPKLCNEASLRNPPAELIAFASEKAQAEFQLLLSKAASNVSRDPACDSAEKINEKLDLLQSLANKYQVEQGEKLKDLSDNMDAVGQKISSLSEAITDQHRKIDATEESLSRIEGDLDFLKEVMFDSMTPSQQLRMYRAGLYSPKGFDEKKAETAAAVDEFQKKSKAFFTDASTVLTFARNLKAAGLGISDEDITQVEIALKTTENVVQAGLLVYAGGPMGYIGAANCVFAAFSRSSGPTSDSAAILAAIQSVQIEVRASRREVIGKLQDFEERALSRLVSLQAGQAKISSEVLRLDRKIDGLQQSLANIGGALKDMSDRQIAFEGKVLDELYQIKRGIWMIRRDIKDFRIQKAVHLIAFTDGCLKLWPDGKIANYREAQEFFEEDDGERSKEWSLADEFVKELFYPRNGRIDSIFFSDSTVEANLIDGDGQVDSFLTKVASPMFRLVNEMIEKAVLGRRQFLALFCPVYSIEEIPEHLVKYECSTLHDTNLLFRKDMSNLIDPLFLLEFVPRLCMFVQWYEVVETLDAPKHLLAGDRLLSGNRTNRVGYGYLLTAKRLLDIAILQQNLLDGDSLLPLMVDTLFRAKGLVKVALLETEIKQLELDINTPDVDLDRFNRYIEYDTALLAQSDVSRLSELRSSHDRAIQQMSGQYFAAREQDLRASYDKPSRTNIIEAEILEISSRGENPAPVDGNIPQKSEAVQDIVLALTDICNKRASIEQEMYYKSQMFNEYKERLGGYQRVVNEINAARAGKVAQKTELERRKKELAKIVGSEKPELLGIYTLLREALRRNGRLTRNFMTFFVVDRLRRAGRTCGQYRLSLTIDYPTGLCRLLGIDPSLWKVRVSQQPKGPGLLWELELEGGGEPLFLPFPSADDVLRALVIHSRELISLVAVRDRVIGEINNICLGQSC
ncbi:hypothetical protein [Planctopirus hydrillae]|uniref:Uncharacterized protein n=1 Tax=Planctopirus hydrillae TaxID=1841610 RepID=A0A1C3E4K6_9PLAN|nr:hypothetical protein [Planctopirus hydrillae]ODA28182.1 hypothetical protein A6X21_13495 [Planctopirus hydrillae]